MIPGLTITDYPDVKAIAERLDCNVPTGVALMPRNFDEAKSKAELIHEDTVKTLRTIMREQGITETRFERDGERFRYIQENAYLEGIVFFVAATACTHDPNLLSVTLNMVSNYLTDTLKGAGRLLAVDQRAKVDFIVETKRGCKRLNYDGPVAGIKDLEGVIRAVQEDT